MPVDYSKWDALELSDDSDIEVHPNVDKKSFIRAKQAQIHQERAQRKHHIDTLRYERVLNDGLATRIQSLMDALRQRADQAKTRSPAEVAFEALMASSVARPGGGGDDQPPPPPEGVHSDTAGSPPTYSKMMAALLDQVNKTLDEKQPTDRYTAMLDEIGEHLTRVRGLQADLIKKLNELEREEGRKITSESYHTGFSSSHVVPTKAGEEGDGDKTSSSSSDPRTVELINPGYVGPGEAARTSDSDEIEASPAARTFGEIKPGEYRESAEFLSRHPQLLTEAETDGLLVLAFDAALQSREEDSRRLVHQALLLQYCRALGRDGVALFFRRITTKGHQARDVFFKDVQDTYGRIRSRSAEIRAQRAAEGADGEGEGQEGEAGAAGVEQIQLQSVEPGTAIAIRVPPVIPDDARIEGIEGLEGEELDHARDRLLADARRARKTFEGFSPAMRTALESGSLDNVNKELAKMTVEDAEALVGLFGEANILSVEEDIIDTTTEEGRRQLEEKKRREGGAAAEGEPTWPDEVVGAEGRTPDPE